ncbi:valine--tRNA ligase [Myxococcota bacterium]|nr:valine--tRNA ligase [Myxococcota bacterium]MBU1382488.1 valine--tRNA ligase [Myxococcota bacterium]MBU1497950.1 valine--tRNA ligase [Myxococcota bacterium]
MAEYNPLDFEEKIYEYWEKSGFFKASDKSTKPPYCIVIPPPNVTGALHMGHALTNTIQDILIRWRRMQGYNAMWLPGTDHAGIATQAVVERNLRRDGLSRHDIGRSAFIDKVWEWKDQYGKRITDQLRRIGSSLDWERERFTMDEGLSHAVTEVFVRLHEEGLIYRDNRLINWCTSCRTALSNLEVEHESHDGNFWHIKYPQVDENGNETGKYVEIATTRPETLLGDTAVAVNPDPEKTIRSRLASLKAKLQEVTEESYNDTAKEIAKIEEILAGDGIIRLRDLASFIGTSLKLPLTDRIIPVVADEHADPSFGTGAVKITPGHDFNDFEVGKRNSLENINILSGDGTLNENVPEKYQKLTIENARKLVVEDLEKLKLLVNVVPHEHEVGHCSRCNTVVEPLLSLQWYVKTAPLAKEALSAVTEGKTEIIPPMWNKVYAHWMENIEDWCVSRQLWWGHQIPAWYCPDGHATVARTEPSKCSVCGNTNLTRDEDVLDTWFSSALWPFSTLGWPEETDALSTFYPNAVMETGFDILFFWVARMMMMGIHFMGEVPFKKVFLHAMVRDAEGRKMSKSLGNTIDPLDVIYGISLENLIEKIEKGLPPESEKEERRHRILDGIRKKYPDGIEPHGADSLRFTLAVMAAQGRDVKLDLARVSGYRAFCNKIWQAFHGVFLRNIGETTPLSVSSIDLSTADRWILSRLASAVSAVNKNLEDFRLNDAADAIYKFVWHELCDWYLEIIKSDLYGNNGENAKASRLGVLNEVFQVVFRLLHPFMPFITEELWQKLPREKGALIIENFPMEEDYPVDVKSVEEFELVREVINAIRTIRGETSIPVKAEIQVNLRFDVPESEEIIRKNSNYILGHLTRSTAVNFVTSRPTMSAATPVKGGELFIPLEGLVNFDDEIKRLEKTLSKSEKDLEVVEKKLSNQSFINNAPAEVIEENRLRLAENRDRTEKLKKSLTYFKGLLEESRNKASDE